jgi:hypothetical protein
LHLKVNKCGPSASRWINKGLPSRILHVFSQACNLVNTEGEVLSIVGPEVGAGPFSVVLDFDENGSSRFSGFVEWIDASSPIRITPEKIFLGDLEIDVSCTDGWDPRPDWSEIRRSREMWLDQIPAIRKVMDQEAPGESLYQIVDEIVPEDRENLQQDRVLSLLQEKITIAARILIQGIVNQVDEKIESGAGGLAGLGGGLTPAGDDFIMGILLGLRAIAPPESLSSIAETILDIAVPQTNALSAAWLQAAANGEVHETWHPFLDALVDGSPAERQIAVRGILDVGYSSGADALAGFVLIVQSGSAKH